MSLALKVPGMISPAGINSNFGQNLFNATGSTFNATLNALNPAASNTISTTGNVIGSGVGTVGNTLSSGVNTVGNTVGGAVTTAGSTVQNLGNSAGGLLSSASSGTKNTLSSIGSSATDLLRSAGSSVGGLISAGGSGLASVITGVKGSVNATGQYKPATTTTATTTTTPQPQVGTGTQQILNTSTAKPESTVNKPISSVNTSQTPTPSLYSKISSYLGVGSSSPVPVQTANLPSYPLSSYYGNLATDKPPAPKVSFNNNVSTRPVNVQSPSPEKNVPKPNPMPAKAPSATIVNVPAKAPAVEFVASQDKLGPFESPYGKYTIYQ
jgi:hypothetical protein